MHLKNLKTLHLKTLNKMEINIVVQVAAVKNFIS